MAGRHVGFEHIEDVEIGSLEMITTDGISS